MSNALTVRVPSPQPATPTASVRGFTRGGNDGPAMGSTRFDAVLADHAAPRTPPQVKPIPAAARPSAHDVGSARTSDQSAEPGPVMKSTLPVKRREDKDHGLLAACASATVPSATDPACPIALDATAASEAGALTAPAVGVVPVVPNHVPSTPAPTVSGRAALQLAVVPDTGSGATSAVVAAGVGGVVPGRIGPEAPASPVLGVDSPLSTSDSSAPPPFVADAQPAAPAAPVLPPAAAPVVPPVLPPAAAPVVVSRGRGHTSAAVSTDAGGVVPGRIGQEVPTAAGPNGVPVLSTSVRSATVPIASDLPLVAPVVAPVLAPVAVPVVAPVVAPGTGSGHTRAVVTAGSGAQVPAHTGPEATTPAISSPAQPADAVTTATWTQTQGTDAAPVAGVAGPPTATGLSVVPMLSTSVPPTTLPTVSSAPATGQPAGALFPEPVHQQVYTAVSPLLRGADGSYGIQLNLHPDDLGAVRVNVDVRHGEISIQMHAADPAARDALRNGLSDLRQQLEDQGLRAGSMNVGSGGANARQPEESRSRSPGIEPPRLERNPSEQLGATAVAASSTTLDLRM